MKFGNILEFEDRIELLHENTIEIELYYPRIEEEKIKFIEVGLTDVRAADNIRISYDFGRDGYKIEQASIFEWEMNDEECNQDWQEVAFIKAWARQ